MAVSRTQLRRRVLIGVRALQAVSIAILADLRAKNEITLVIAYLAMLLLLGSFFVFEYLLDDFERTTEVERERVRHDELAALNKQHDADLTQLRANFAEEAASREAQLNAASLAVSYLVGTYRLTSRAIAGQRRALETRAFGATRDIKKHQIVAETLRNLCHAVRETASTERRLPISQVVAKATFMEVSAGLLHYVAWATPSDAPPRSFSLNVTFEPKDGCAGWAWHRKRPVIEHDFSTREWRDNYPEQGELYRTQNMSMVCVPVLRLEEHSVVGIITVDVNLPAFFGMRDSKQDEERIGRWFLPYAAYISFIYSVAEFAEVAQPLLAAAAASLAVVPIAGSSRPAIQPINEQ